MQIDDADPDSRALILKLHRELNASTRTARRAGQQQLQSYPSLDKSQQRAAGNKGRRDTTSESRDSGRKRSRSVDGDDQAHTSVQRVKHEERSGDNSNAARRQKQQQRGSSDPSQPSSAANAADHEATASRALAAGLKHPATSQQHRKQLPPPAAAAATAADAVRRRVQLQADSGAVDSARKLVKVFHAGVRWGISVPREALRSRADLARALNEAYEGHITSVGRGNTLSVVIVGAKGDVQELRPPFVGGSVVKESAAHWKALVDGAARVYVHAIMPGSQMRSPGMA